MGMMRCGAAASTWMLLFLVTPVAHGGILHADRKLLLCHRTANRDLPENTLEALAYAAHMGCDIVEVDVRRTLDGELVLNHDGFLDRFTDTTGEVEGMDLRELDGMDFGAWMGERFSGMRLAHFDDALRLARELKIGLYLDIKDKGIGPQVLEAVAREGMTKQVMFGGEWDDIHRLDPTANEDASASLQPGFTREQVQALHAQGKIVIANFILNGHEFDLDGMRQAMAFGADGIMVDYPRLGGEAVGRPIEAKIAVLSKQAEEGSTDERVRAIRELGLLTGLPLEGKFLHWLLDGDERVSHEAAIALVFSRPPPALSFFEAATHAASATARSNAAWAIGWLARSAPGGEKCGPLLAPLLKDGSSEVVKQALVGISRCARDPQGVPAAELVRILSGNVPVLRGLAAVALAKHHPEIAEREVKRQLEEDERTFDTFSADWTARGRPALSQAQIDWAIEMYRAQMKEEEALSQEPGKAALEPLESQAFRPGQDYSMMPILMAGFKLWDRLEDDPAPAIRALAAKDAGVADWAEWALVKAGPKALPAVRGELAHSEGDLRRRLIQILAWQGDVGALPLLLAMEKERGADAELLEWAITRIEAYCPTESGDEGRCR
jgi:glycerophosphoryl diester phosphodiesterase